MRYPPDEEPEEIPHQPDDYKEEEEVEDFSEFDDAMFREGVDRDDTAGSTSGAGVTTEEAGQTESEDFENFEEETEEAFL